MRFVSSKSRDRAGLPHPNQPLEGAEKALESIRLGVVRPSAPVLLSRQLPGRMDLVAADVLEKSIERDKMPAVHLDWSPLVANRHTLAGVD